MEHLNLSGSLSVGPQLAKLLGTPRFSSEKDLSEVLLRHLDDTDPPLDLVEGVVDELVAMDLPVLALQVIDRTANWAPTSYGPALAEGAASMLAGDLARAEEVLYRANEIAPAEPATYVNLAQIFSQTGRYQDAVAWCLAGLDVEPNHGPLWSVLIQAYEAESSAAAPTLAMQEARDRGSWVGICCAAELDPLVGPEEKLESLREIYRQGERSAEFLIEYTGTLGATLRYSEIPAVRWEAKRHTGAGSWQLDIHTAQAFLAMEKEEEYQTLKQELLNRKDLPVDISQILQQVEEVETRS